jgi:glyoxylase-like metal-dependent hydrolase (beta-lactamase superfamily II)
MRPVVRRALRGRAPVQEWPRVTADPSTPAGAIDLLGDGSLWALPTPGHTDGHTAYLALTTDGPVLFVGDASHTRWGWDHGVAPGWFSDDRERGAESLRQLRALVAANPSIRVEVGHEATGEDAVTAGAIRRGARQAETTTAAGP